MTLSDEAKAVAYRSGVRELAALAQRVIDLEALVAGLTARFDAVERTQKNTAPPHLAKVERR